MAPKFEAVLWDIDGTLVDGETTYHNCVIAVSGNDGIVISHHDLIPLSGYSAEDQFNYLAEKKLVADTYEYKAWNETVMALCYATAHKIDVMPGAFLFLEALIQANIKLGACTNGERKYSHQKLRRLGSYADLFETVVSCDDVDYPKPQPHVYLKGAQDLGLLPQNCYAIEDSLAGAQAAKAADMPLIFVNADPRKRKRATLEVLDPQTDICVTSLADRELYTHFNFSVPIIKKSLRRTFAP